MIYDVLVIGAGASGLMAGIWAGRKGASVLILERNRKAGVKLAITGKGRCNFTNICEIDGFIRNIPGNGRFLYSALNRFTNRDLIDFLGSLGVESKVERGGRVFPESDKAWHLVKALVGEAERVGVGFRYGAKVVEISADERGFSHVVLEGGEKISGRACVLAAGGSSYPLSGSDGSGYYLASRLGHNVVKPLPSLVPLETEGSLARNLQGLTLKNVKATLFDGEDALRSEFGEMLFTHFGLSGPIILTLSRDVARLLEKGADNLWIEIDLKPALSLESLDARIQRDFERYSRKHFGNALSDLLPKRLIPEIIRLSGIPEDRPVNQVTRDERLELARLFKGLEFKVKGTRGMDEAIVTSGGVSVKEIDPRSMESKLVPRLFFSGEVIDVDGYTGGYNLQAAFSTGYLAGISAAEAAFEVSGEAGALSSVDL